MDHPKKKQKRQAYTEEKRFQLYAIIFPEEKTFFSGFTAQEDLSYVYRDHYNLKSKWTASLFEAYKVNEKRPDMYYLDTVNVTRNKAFFCSVVWSKRLIEEGYKCLNLSRGDTYQWHLDHFTDEMTEYLDLISSKPISDILDPQWSLFPDYGKQSRRRNAVEGSNLKRNITISLSNDDYLHISKRAAIAGMSPTKYCRNMAMWRTPIVVDLDGFQPLTEAISDAHDDALYSLRCIFETGKANQEDLRQLREMAEKIEAVGSDVNTKFIRLMDRVQRARKTSDSGLLLSDDERTSIKSLFARRIDELQKEKYDKELETLFDTGGHLPDDDPIIKETALLNRLTTVL